MTFHSRLDAACGRGFDWRAYVDDGSRDASWSSCADRQARPRARRAAHAQLTRTALTCGLQRGSGGDAVVPDADLQDPPELIPALVARWREGDVALIDAVRRSRDGEGWFKRLSAHLFYRVMGRLAQVPVRAGLGDFRLLDRRRQAFKRLPERTLCFIKGLFA
jgi:glycosyltransferase involved in cell wall biosynthesis